MKRQVGQRINNPSPDLRAALSLVSLCCTAQMPTAKVVTHRECINCRATIDVSFFEDIKTGKVWIEGPDDCPKCKCRIAASDGVQLPQLSQEVIERLFGKF
jgi:hypothetical protein